MEIKKNRSLKDLNTFGVNARTKYYTEIHNLDDIHDLLAWKNQNELPALLLGGGSNLLFKNDYQGLVAKISLSGKEVLEDSSWHSTEHTYISVAAGENWHDFVRWTIAQGYAGLENLSLIPGTVGAAPIQNIGAYGVELADHFHSLQAVNLENGDVLEFDKERCQFGYRDSFFKTYGLDRLLITSVTFVLLKKPQWKIDYAGVRDALEGLEPNAKLISDAIIKLRQNKLPDPDVIGNAGSFFKNPILNSDIWETIKADNPDLPGYPQSNKMIKTSAAWLIDACGWKGYKKGNVGISERHALVLVNHGQATGAELWALAEEIMASVEEKFGLLLEPEPRVMV